MKGCCNGLHGTGAITSSKDALHTGLVKGRIDLDRAHGRNLEPELLGESSSELGLWLVSQEPFGLTAVTLVADELQGDLSSLWTLDELGDLARVHRHGCRAGLERILKLLAELLIAVGVDCDGVGHAKGLASNVEGYYPFATVALGEHTG